MFRQRPGARIRYYAAMKAVSTIALCLLAVALFTSALEIIDGKRELTVFNGGMAIFQVVFWGGCFLYSRKKLMEPR